MNKTKEKTYGGYKMRNIILLALGLSILILSGCATATPQTTTTGHARTRQITDAPIVHIPVVADLTISQTKVTGVAEGNIYAMGGVEAIRTLAIINALRPTNADILIQPTYELTQRGNHVRIEVTGFPASYNNFRNINSNDVNLLYMHRERPATPPHSQPQRRRDRTPSPVPAHSP